MAYIGVKLANGEFYPIFEETTPAKKKLVVTTVNDNQPNVQIDLYRGEPGSPVDDSSYIGSLLVNDIARAPKGVPDIELDVVLKEDMTLEAFAQDKVSGGQSKFSISLTELSYENIQEVPQFDIQETETLIDESLFDANVMNAQSAYDELEIEEPVNIDQSELNALEMELTESEVESENESDVNDFAESETLSLDELTNIENSGVFPQGEQTLEMPDENLSYEELSNSTEELPALSDEIDFEQIDAGAEETAASVPGASVPGVELDIELDIETEDTAAEAEPNDEFSLGGELRLELPESEENQASVEKPVSILEESEETSYLGPDTISFDVELPDADIEETSDEELEEFPGEPAERIPLDLEFESQEIQESREDFSSSELSLETEPLGLEEETVFSVEAQRAKNAPQKAMRKDRKKAQKIPEESKTNEKKPCAPLWCKILIPLALILLAAVIVLLIGRCSAAQRDAGAAKATVTALEQPIVKPNTAQQPESGSSAPQGTANQGDASVTAETGMAETGPAAVSGVQQGKDMQGQQGNQQAGSTGTSAQTQPPQTQPVVTKPAQTTQQAKPSASSKPPKPAPGSKKPGVWYKIRWGDTLWDLSIAFYRTPWKYMKIYNANRKLIKHPDKIISGTWIYVPK